jgi:DNA helicase-2/ATP-dependent DNA helicase PcrA
MNATPSPFASGQPDPERSRRFTPEQADAITYGEGPQAILAGPGSGKTGVVIARAAHLVTAEDPGCAGRPLARPEEVVVVTFTNSAAEECALRLRDRLGPDAIKGMTISTLHSLCVRVLRRHAPAIGREDNFTIYDQGEVRAVLRYVLEDQERTAVQQLVQQFGACSPIEMHEEISLAKNRLWSPGFYEQHSQHPVAPLIAAAWRELDAELADSNALDFDDLQCCCVDLFNRHPGLLMSYRSRLLWLLVDEVQDLNYAQMGLVQLLGAPGGNVTIVGDVNQRVFGWRGADARNLIAFSEAFPAHRTIALGRNFRSKEEIVRAAARLIAHNATAVAIEYTSDRGPGAVIEVHAFENEWVEAAWIADEIGRLISGGLSADQILVTARTAFATKPVQRALAQANIKHRVIGSLGLYERPEIKDALAYLWLLVNPADAGSLRRALSVPARGAGSATLDALVGYARAGRLDLLTACTHADQLSRVRARTRESILRFGNGMLQVRAEHAAGRSLGHTVAAALMLDGGLVQYHKNRHETAKRKEERHDAKQVLDDLRSVWRAASTYEEQQGPLASLLGFLEAAVGLHGHRELSSQDAVVDVSTMHRAKGLGRTVVFICACEQGVAPSWRALETGAVEALEEERCVFFVAESRAEDELYLTWCRHRNGRPTRGQSQFIPESGLPLPDQRGR